jgi:hypothetical protein
MNDNTLNSRTMPMQDVTPFAPRYSCLVRGGIKAYSRLEGERIHCTAGHLWVTFERDRTDYLLFPGEHLGVPNQGKLLISGPGCFRISKDIDGMDLAIAS